MNATTGYCVDAEDGAREQRVESAQLRQCQKAAAVALYMHGVLPLAGVQRMFAANPRWRSV